MARATSGGASATTSREAGRMRARTLRWGRSLASSDVSACEGFDIAVISVPTPLRDGLPDLDFVRRAASMLARYVSAGSIVVLESTTYPGTTEEVVAPILEEGSG